MSDGVSDGLPRLLVMMGSGETSPTMVKPHRELLARLGPPPVPAVLLDTPFGFQANASDISARAVAYFAQSVGQEITVASFRSAAAAAPVEYEAMLNRVREARYVFSGPGSPSYALRQWSGSLVPELLRKKLAEGGCVTFASAAALTLGVATVPVYEIYKVGAEPAWLEGLNLLAEAGLGAAVIPHYDNAEGGNHDTRFCYLGEGRLAAMEAQLPAGTFVLGVDEHTACVLDLGARTATVLGRGAVTVRARGRSATVPSGATVPIAHLEELADRLARDGRAEKAGAGAGAGGAADSGEAPGAPPAPPEVGTAGSPFLEALAATEASFADAVARRDVAAAVGCVLDLEAELAAWSADTFQSDELDRGRAALRSMIARLGELAGSAPAGRREVVAPFVEMLLERRAAAREERRWAEADLVRDRLLDLGLSVQDEPGGTTWDLPAP